MDFEHYVTARGQALSRLAYLLTADLGAAEDLVQVTLLLTYRHWRRVSHADDPDAYVRRMLVNAHLADARRASKRREIVGLPDREAPSQAPDPSETLAERERLWRELVALPPRSRAVIVLRYYEDLDDAAIAAVLGITASTVRATAARGIATLRARITQTDAATVGEQRDN